MRLDSGFWLEWSPLVSSLLINCKLTRSRTFHRTNRNLSKMIIAKRRKKCSCEYLYSPLINSFGCFVVVVFGWRFVDNYNHGSEVIHWWLFFFFFEIYRRILFRGFLIFYGISVKVFFFCRKNLFLIYLFLSIATKQICYQSSKPIC